MSKKIGRNDRCWCGSGKKFKRCHYRRAREEPVSQQGLLDLARKIKIGKAECLHPNAPHNCKGKIIKAHTIQKNGGLSSISKNGHIYTPKYSVLLDDTFVKMKLQGINKASTITGFCGLHDKQLFTPIEDYDLQPTVEQSLLLAYRAICREVFAKRSAIKSVSLGRSLDRGKDILSQVDIQDHYNWYEFGATKGLENLEYHKSHMDNAIINRNFQDVFYYAIQFDRIPDILCSGSFHPTYDFHGNQLQDLEFIIETGIQADHIAFSLLSNSKGGIGLFSWIGDQKANTGFVQSLHALSDIQVVHSLFRLTVEYFENIFLAPVWWENLTKTQQQKFISRFENSIDRGGSHDPNCLVDDGIRLVNWKFLGRYTNLKLQVNI